MKSFLERNKIYFEIFTSLLFGLAALFVSLASYRISNQQLALNSQAQQPHFSVQTSYIFNPGTQKYDETQLYVNNVSGFAYNIHCQVYSFIALTLSVDGKRETSLVPLIGYYPVSHRTDSSVGTLFVFSGGANNARYIGLENSLRNEPLPVNKSFVESKLENLVTIDYLDTTNVKHTSYFLDGEAIEEDEAKKKLEDYGAMKPLDIEKATAEDVFSAASQKP